MIPRNRHTAALILLALLAVALVGWRWLHDAAYVFLSDDAEAHWLGAPTDDPLLLGHTGLNMARFRARLACTGNGPTQSLVLHTTGAASLRVDGEPVFRTHASPTDVAAEDMRRWTVAHRFTLPPLEPGEHQLELRLASFSGVPLFLLQGLPESTVWEGSADGSRWLPAQTARVNAAYRRLSQGLSLPWLRVDASIPPFYAIDGSTAWLRQTWQLADATPATTREFHCLERCEAWLDGRALDLRQPTHWKLPVTVAIPALAQGRHEFLLRASHPLGVPAVQVPATDRVAWEASNDARSWMPARRLADRPVSRLSGYFPDGATVALFIAPGFIVLGALLAAVTTLARRNPRFGERLAQPRTWLLLLIAAWCALGAHNLLNLPGDFGFDARQQLEYIRFVAEYAAVPLGTDGWQMFQSPLYYLLSAALMRLAEPWWQGDSLVRILRLLPLACGALQIALVAWALRLVFPTDRWVRNLALVVGGFLPISVYMSQSLGNEPLAGCLSALAVCLALRLLLPPASAHFIRDCAALGAVWGLALLTKVTPLLLGPVLAVVVLGCAKQRSAAPSETAAAAMALGLGCVAVCGWYYAANWLALGRPFIGGWDASRGFLWVQPPGYRMPDDLYAFGAALTQPVLAGVHGFWNGLHSTFWLDGLLGGNSYDSAAAMRQLLPWNPALLVAGALLALVPGALMLRGAARALASTTPALQLAVITPAIYLAALLEMYMRLPAYSSLKASYMLGLLPCFAILVGAGIDAWSGSRLMRALLLLGLSGWWVVVFATYWSR